MARKNAYSKLNRNQKSSYNASRRNGYTHRQALGIASGRLSGS